MKESVERIEPPGALVVSCLMQPVMSVGMRAVMRSMAASLRWDVCVVFIESVSGTLV